MATLGTAHATTYTQPKSAIEYVEKQMEKTKTRFSPEILEKQAGVSFGPSKELQDLKKVLTYDDLVKQLDVEKNKADRRKALFENKGQKFGGIEADKRAEEIIKKNAKKVNWKKIGKWGAIAVVGAVLVGLAAWGIKKYNENKAANVTNVEPQPESLPTPIAAKAELDKKHAPVPEPAITTPLDPKSPVDADGKMTVQKGDGLWHIAERYLEAKFKTEPEKFANLTKKEQNKMIYKEMIRIAKLYEAQLNEDNQSKNPIKVTYQDVVINGKTQRVAIPMLRTGQKIQVVEKLDKAA